MSLVSAFVGALAGVFAGAVLDSLKQQRHELLNTIILLHQLAEILAEHEANNHQMNSFKDAIQSIIDGRPISFDDLHLVDFFNGKDIPQIDLTKSYSTTKHSPITVGDIAYLNVNLMNFASNIKNNQEFAELHYSQKDLSGSTVVKPVVPQQTMKITMHNISKYQQDIELGVKAIAESIIQDFDRPKVLYLFYSETIAYCKKIANNLANNSPVLIPPRRNYNS